MDLNISKHLRNTIVSKQSTERKLTEYIYWNREIHNYIILVVWKFYIPGVSIYLLNLYWVEKVKYILKKIIITMGIL